MKRIILALLLTTGAFATTVTVTRAVKGLDEQPASGVAYIRISAPCRSGSNYIGDRQITVRFTAGAFSQALVPTDTCPTTGATGSAWSISTAYAVGDHVQYLGGVWLAVTASTGVAPGTLASGKTSSTQTWRLISPSYSVSWALTGGTETTETWQIASDGTVYVQQVATLPSVPVAGPPGQPFDTTGLADGGYCVLVTAGVPRLANTGCPGGITVLSWSALTSGQWASLSSAQWATITP